MSQSIERQGLENLKELKAKLLSVLVQNLNGLTKNEMLVQSGISQELIDFVLRGILEEYTIHLEVKGNQVIYLLDLKSPKNVSIGKVSPSKKFW